MDLNPETTKKKRLALSACFASQRRHSSQRDEREELREHLWMSREENVALATRIGELESEQRRYKEMIGTQITEMKQKLVRREREQTRKYQTLCKQNEALRSDKRIIEQTLSERETAHQRDKRETKRKMDALEQRSKVHLKKMQIPKPKTKRCQSCKALRKEKAANAEKMREQKQKSDQNLCALKVTHQRYRRSAQKHIAALKKESVHLNLERERLRGELEVLRRKESRHKTQKRRSESKDGADREEMARTVTDLRQRNERLVARQKEMSETVRVDVAEHQKATKAAMRAVHDAEQRLMAAEHEKAEIAQKLNELTKQTLKDLFVKTQRNDELTAQLRASLRRNNKAINRRTVRKVQKAMARTRRCLLDVESAVNFGPMLILLKESTIAFERFKANAKQKKKSKHAHSNEQRRKKKKWLLMDGSGDGAAMAMI